MKLVAGDRFARSVQTRQLSPTIAAWPGTGTRSSRASDSEVILASWGWAERTDSIPEDWNDPENQGANRARNISQIAREENRHWTTVKRIVEEKDVQEYVTDLRGRFYGALEDVLIAVIQYVKNGKDGGLLAYKMLVDAGVIPQKDGRNRPAIETQKPPDPVRDREQSRITMIATHMAKRAIERQRFSAPCHDCQFSRS